MSGIIDEIRQFLASLKSEIPELFKEAPPRVAPRREGAIESARDLFTGRARFWSERMGVRFNRIFIKDQRTLWGSCSAKGNLNFNWRVALAPEAVVDYLVIHELAHLLEMNHSRRFWAHVAQHCPDYKRHRRWLRENGQKLKSSAMPSALPPECVPAKLFPARQAGFPGVSAAA